MKRHGKWILSAGAFVLAAAVFAAATEYYRCRRAHENLRDLQWWEESTPEEKLAVAHQAIRWPIGDPHDAFLIICDHGGPESVPPLIRALKWQEHTVPGGDMLCTKAHCLQALRKITGVDAGLNYEDWKAWRDSVDHRVPERHAQEGLPVNR